MSSLALYDCKVGMRASDGPVVIHEARKLGVTAPEILVLQAVHSEDLVTEIRHSLVKRDFPKKKERERLSLLYGEAKVKEALGAKAAPMPVELDADQVAPALERPAPKSQAADDEPDLDETPDPAPRGKRPIKVA